MIAFTFQPDGSSHNDLLLVVGAEEWRCDSYYFALDPGIDEEREDDVKARRVLHRLLEQWCDAVGDLAEDRPAFLPFDYSDQYTGCLRVIRCGELVEVQVGYSSREGWATYPCDISDYVLSVSDFLGDHPPLKMRHDELLRCIQESARRAEAA